MNQPISVTITNGLSPICEAFEAWLKTKADDVQFINCSETSYYFEFEAGHYDDEFNDTITRKLRLSNHNGHISDTDIDVRYSFDGNAAEISGEYLDCVEKWINELKAEVQS